MKKLIVMLSFVLLSQAVWATMPVNTFSIVGYDPATGEVGVAVASKYFAVGSVVPWTKADIGAIATQAWVNADYGIIGLELLEKGMSPGEVVDSLTKADTLSSRRQLGIIDCKGRSASFTGTGCMKWAGGMTGVNCAAQGNILESEDVVARMIEAFENTKAELGARLLAALLAGDAAGGDTRGRQSAALYVVKKNAGARYDREIDIRVDDHQEPFRELARLYHISSALTHLEKASRLNQQGDIMGAINEARLSVQAGPELPETYYDLACYLSLAGETEEAMENIATALRMAPRYKSMAANDSDLTALRGLKKFQVLTAEPKE